MLLARQCYQLEARHLVIRQRDAVTVNALTGVDDENGTRTFRRTRLCGERDDGQDQCGQPYEEGDEPSPESPHPINKRPR